MVNRLLLDAEQEWYRLEREQQIRHDQLVHTQQAQQELFSPPASRTAVEVRLNAYISDDLSLPKPYGAMAPFKPSTPGANLRHFKTPKCEACCDIVLSLIALGSALLLCFCPVCLLLYVNAPLFRVLFHYF